jgi:secreted protein with Ig-like and vWFA domain
MNPEDLTTHALGEPLSPADREALEQTLQADAQARADFEATLAFTQFLQQTLATEHPDAALTEEQKQRLLHSGSDVPVALNPVSPESPLPASTPTSVPASNKCDPAGRPTALRWLTRTALPLSAAALIVLGFQQWREETSPQDFANIELQKQSPATWAMQPGATRPLQEESDAAKDGHSLYSSQMLAGGPAAVLGDQSALPSKKNEPSNATAGYDMVTPSNGSSELKRSELAAAPSDETRAQMLSQVTRAWEGPAPSPSIGAMPASAAAPLRQSIAPLSEGLATSDALVRRRDFGDSSNDLPGARLSFDSQRADTPSNESYTPIQENALTAVLREPLSTFSIDVDTASYANTRRFLNRSSLPPRDAVRIEELVNYFPYNLEAPAPDSPHPFAVHVEVADCPWQPQHRLARIGIQGKKVGLEQRNSNFVFLVDVSGSMDQPDKLPLVKESLRLLVEQLDEKDRVSIFTYAGSSGLVLPPTPGDQKDRLLAAITKMTPGGSTHGSAGIQLAYEQAIAAFIPDGVNRVILCSDGDFNVGVSSPQELEKLITEKARSGVFLSVLGYGTGNLKDRTMETLADKGNGNYGYIDSLSEARKLLVEQRTGTLVTIAKDVKIQVEFNPAHVASYRLIGYENRLLAKEDFNNDTKDAGEIGAGHSVNALYEIVPVGLTPPTTPVDPLKYQTPPAAAAPAAEPDAISPELLTVKLRYKAPDAATSQLIEVPVTDQKTTLAAATPEFKFTTAVAAYGLMLRQSSYRGNLTWDQIRNLALEGKTPDPHGYRAEFLQLLDKARGLMPDRQ